MPDNLETSVKRIVKSLIYFSIHSCDTSRAPANEILEMKREIYTKIDCRDFHLKDIPAVILCEAIQDLAFYFRVFGPQESASMMQKIEASLATNRPRELI